jgi:hypothetical protein
LAAGVLSFFADSNPLKRLSPRRKRFADTLQQVYALDRGFAALFSGFSASE